MKRCGFVSFTSGTIDVITEQGVLTQNPERHQILTTSENVLGMTLPRKPGEKLSFRKNIPSSKTCSRNPRRTRMRGHAIILLAAFAGASACAPAHVSNRGQVMSLRSDSLGLIGGLEPHKIETRLIDERFASVMGECVTSHSPVKQVRMFIMNR